MRRMIFICAGAFLMSTCTSQQNGKMGHTEITTWQYGRRSAVTVSYDDGSINQFRIALPIMNKLNIPATFYIITGNIPGSTYQGKFLGRPVKTIIAETAAIPTNKDNFYERSSAARFLGFRGTAEYHTRAGAKFEAGKPEDAYSIIDELYKKVRNGEYLPENIRIVEKNNARGVTWDDIRSYAAQGHEFASHTVTHPYLCALDEVNILYELEKSREDILEQLGPKHTFSGEVPYGTYEKRSMQYALNTYPAIRNVMPDSIIEEIYRSSPKDPGSFKNKYVRWQRQAVVNTTLPVMKSWIDTTAANDNIWLVLIFHGVDGIGWEALPGELLEEYFLYMKSREDVLWITTYADGVKYIRERMNAAVNTTINDGKITVTLAHSLDKTMYDLPLTLKTYVSSNWTEVRVKQGNENKHIIPQKDVKGSYVLYQAYPDATVIEVSGI